MGRPVHLVRRFVGTLSLAGPAAADVAWVAGTLTDAEMTVWRRLPRHDRRHSVRVARDVEAALAGTEYAGDPRWVEAALLHDIGKLDSRLGVYGRVVATVSGAVVGRDHAEAWSETSGFTRRVGLYLRHTELGGDRIRLAGEPEEAALWSAVHHDPERWAELPIPEPVIAALDAADND